MFSIVLIFSPLLQPFQVSSNLRYRKADGTSYWRSANFSNTNPTHRLTYLEANTRYEVQVQAQCSNTLYGDWSESFFFTTQP